MVNWFSSLLSHRLKKNRWRKHLYVKKKIDLAVKNTKYSKADLERQFQGWSAFVCDSSPSIQLKEIYPLLIDFLRKGNDTKLRYSYLIDKIKILEVTNLDSDILHQLYRIFLSYGFFSVGLSLRKKGVEAKLLLKEGSVLDSIPFILEEGNLLSNIDVLDLFKTKKISDNKIKMVIWLSNIFSSGVCADRCRFVSDADKEFYSYIKDKRIAIVGPIASDVQQGYEIDSFDLVLRFNFKNEMNDYNKKIYGERTSLSYYSIVHTKALKDQDYTLVFNLIDYVCFVKEKSRSFFDKDKFKNRVSYDYRWLLPDTEFNIGVNAIFDLLRFKPSEIKVFNTDLMLTAGRNKNYWPSSVGNVDYIRSFIKTHDPVTQYQFLSHVYRSGLIKGDQRFCEVMEMGLENYISELQLVHGAPS